MKWCKADKLGGRTRGRGTQRHRIYVLYMARSR